MLGHLLKMPFVLNMRLGTVKFYDKEKGLGLITPSNGGTDFRFSSSGLLDPIEPNNIVLFDIHFVEKRVEAIDVKVLAS
ncbi:cold-shock protein [Pedobacter sandarakinus]|uniref:cold-shock protein n=1 Tax=Pedobacter sandarakinus TaxID=353156 RepID=UPI002247ED7B|nr:cold shock domain-containing protein [Pedobacter sandarakinus]MCX2574970.1 cold shock domain-containing protein [Pedobacter sandarakinus]